MCKRKKAWLVAMPFLLFSFILTNSMVILCNGKLLRIWELKERGLDRRFPQVRIRP
jgi:hypothetical protein